MQIHVNQLSFLKAVSSFRGAGGCGSIITASTVALLWKWGAGLLGGPNKTRLGAETVGERQHREVYSEPL